MKFLKSFTLFAIFLFSLNSTAQQLDAEIMPLKIDVVYLASDYLEGRLTGTIGEQRAAEYIASRYQQIGLSPKGDQQSYYQVFPFKEMSNPHNINAKPSLQGNGTNVVGYIDNNAPTTIVVGAHYDHLGSGGIGSLHAGEPAIHNGADDNASGIAAMLRIAERLKNSNLTSNNYLFIAFSGEELGLFGSKYYAEHPTLDLDKVNYMLNMDMVGRLNSEKMLAIYGTGTSSLWPDVLSKIDVGGIQTTTSESGIGPSDHTSFYLKDIPVLHFFTGQHKEYHKPEDDTHLINFEGLRDVADYLFEVIKNTDGFPQLDFKRTKQKEDRKAAAFKVTLGVMPDYVYAGKGMKIDGVLEDRPAQKAGLEDGDIVIKMGDMEVTDIYGYMEALSHYKKGDRVKVTVQRGEKKVTKNVTF